jgi:C1A family cysteine protease
MTQIPPAMRPSRALGWVKDPEDPRDKDASELLKAYRAVATPPSADNEDIVQIVDQGGLGSCTCNATGQAIRAAEILERVSGTGGAAAVSLSEAQATTPFMSRLFAYYLARSYSGDQHEDTGTYIRLVFQVLNKYGFPPESAWPYSDFAGVGAAFTKMPPADAFRQAFDQRANVANINANLLNYGRITGTGDARLNMIEAALAERHLVAFGTPVTEDFCNSVGIEKPVDKPRPDQKLAGGHAMAIAGYRKTPNGTVFKIANSWGTSFGNRGFVEFTSEYIAWPQTTDLWIVRRAPLLPTVNV